jgi:hypothetical protein
MPAAIELGNGCYSQALQVYHQNGKVYNPDNGGLGPSRFMQLQFGSMLRCVGCVCPKEYVLPRRADGREIYVTSSQA